jgi:hypothetical protein
MQVRAGIARETLNDNPIIDFVRTHIKYAPNSFVTNTDITEKMEEYCTKNGFGNWHLKSPSRTTEIILNKYFGIPATTRPRSSKARGLRHVEFAKPTDLALDFLVPSAPEITEDPFLKYPILQSFDSEALQPLEVILDNNFVSIQRNLEKHFRVEDVTKRKEKRIGLKDLKGDVNNSTVCDAETDSDGKTVLDDKVVTPSDGSDMPDSPLLTPDGILIESDLLRMTDSITL